MVIRVHNFFHRTKFFITCADVGWSVACLVGDSVQQSYVSSTETAQNILTNGIIGPLILEVCNSVILSQRIILTMLK